MINKKRRKGMTMGVKKMIKKENMTEKGKKGSLEGEVRKNE